MQLHELNNLPAPQRKEELAKCCGSSAWVQRMTVLFPFSDKDSLLQKADEAWNNLEETDCLAAFNHYPKIGDVTSLQKKFAATADLAANEQAAVQKASQQTIEALAKGNADYEEKFGFIFIVCATGKTAEEMLQRLKTRLPNNREDELTIAAGEQAKITRLRLQKFLGSY